HLDDFTPSLLQFVFEVNIRSRHERMDARMRRLLQRLGGSAYVLFRCTAKGGDGNVAAFAGHGFNRGKVAVRGDRESGFDDVDAERVCVDAGRAVGDVRRADGALVELSGA